MRTFQLDECLNSKKLAAACYLEGKCIAKRFPMDIKGKSAKDPLVMKRFAEAGLAIVTNDWSMPCEHLEDVPEYHAGIIVVGFSEDSKKEINDEESRKILARLKLAIPSWNDIRCDNSVLFISEKSIEIFHKEPRESNRPATLRRDLLTEYSTVDQNEIISALKRNQYRASKEDRNGAAN